MRCYQWKKSYWMWEDGYVPKILSTWVIFWVSLTNFDLKALRNFDCYEKVLCERQWKIKADCLDQGGKTCLRERQNSADCRHKFFQKLVTPALAQFFQKECTFTFLFSIVSVLWFDLFVDGVFYLFKWRSIKNVIKLVAIFKVPFKNLVKIPSKLVKQRQNTSFAFGLIWSVIHQSGINSQNVEIIIQLKSKINVVKKFARTFRHSDEILN